MLRLYTLIAAALFIGLSGCGSSGGGSNNGSSLSSTNTNNEFLSDFTIVKAFGDGSGVATGIRSDGSRSVFIAPDIIEVVQAANNVTESDLDSIEVSDFSVVNSLPNANIRQGAITSDGIVMNITILEDLGGDFGLVLQEVPDIANALFTIGTPLGILPSGTFTYIGTLATGLRSVDPDVQFGNFTMDANFINGTFIFNGSTPSDTLSGNGFINTTTGSISSNSLSFNTGGTARTATMYGNFHGSSAEGVTGIFHSNESNPFYSGGFVGSR